MGSKSLVNTKCRLCLNSVNERLLVDVFGSEDNVARSILQYTGIEIAKKRNKHAKICKHCHIMIKVFTEFKSACFKANELFNQNQAILRSSQWLNKCHLGTLTSIQRIIQTQKNSLDDLQINIEELENHPKEIIKKEQPEVPEKEKPVEEVFLESVKIEFENDGIDNQEVDLKLEDQNYEIGTEVYEADHKEEDILVEIPEKVYTDSIPNIQEMIIECKSKAINGRVKCNVCWCEFNSTNIELHLNNHYNVRPFNCTAVRCRKSFASKKKLGDHLRLRHKGGPKEEPIIPKIKEKRLKAREPCSICGKELTHDAMEGHVNRHLNNFPYFCDDFDCRKTFVSRNELIQHKRKKHRIRLKPKETSIKTKTKGKMGRPKKQNPEILQEIKPKGPTVCDQCGKTMAYRELSDHMNMHMDIRPYTCRECQKSFHSKCRLKKHTLYMHPKPGEEIIKRKSVIVKIPCQVCGKMIDKTIMTPHLNRHNNYRPFKCDIEGCDYAGHGPKELSAHKNVKHSTQPAICPICGKILKHKSRLKHHMSYHSEPTLPCQLCGKLLKNKNSMSAHMLSHTTEKPFSCEFCGKCFQIKKTLKIHLRIHFNIKPYKCDLCDLAFTYNCLLKNHKEKYH